MSLFSGPEEHAANPPETWKVKRKAERTWALTTKDGIELCTAPTKWQAELLITEGLYVKRYRDEGRWYRGEPVRNWRPWAEILVERERERLWRENKNRKGSQ